MPPMMIGSAIHPIAAAVALKRGGRDELRHGAPATSPTRIGSPSAAFGQSTCRLQVEHEASNGQQQFQPNRDGQVIPQTQPDLGRVLTEERQLRHMLDRVTQPVRGNGGANDGTRTSPPGARPRP